MVTELETGKLVHKLEGVRVIKPSFFLFDIFVRKNLTCHFF